METSNLIMEEEPKTDSEDETHDLAMKLYRESIEFESDANKENSAVPPEELGLTLSIDFGSDSDSEFQLENAKGPPALEEMGLNLSIDFGSDSDSESKLELSFYGDPSPLTLKGERSPINSSPPTLTIETDNCDDNFASALDNLVSAHSFMSFNPSPSRTSSPIEDKKPKLLWCKLCDTYYFGLVHLQDHVLHAHKQDPSKITEWNVCTWDLEIAKTIQPR